MAANAATRAERAGRGMTSSAKPEGRGMDELEVADRLLAPNEEGVVLGVETGTLDRIPGERADRRLGLPDADEQEVRPAALEASEREDAPVAGAALVVRQARPAQVLEIAVGVRRAGAPFPQAGDQRAHPFLHDTCEQGYSGVNVSSLMTPVKSIKLVYNGEPWNPPDRCRRSPPTSRSSSSGAGRHWIC